MASTWTSQKFSDRAPDDSVLIRCFVGGAQNEDLALRERSELIAIVREEMSRILGIKTDPLFARAYQWGKSMPQYVVGHGDKIARLEKLLSSHPGLYLAGSAYRGIGISDCIVSGEQAAEGALQFLQPRQ